MRNRRRWVALVIISLALLILDSSVFSFKDTQESRETLREVTPVYVVIEGITPELERNGMSANQLKTDVEFQLRKVGIHVIAAVEERDPAGFFPAGLYVRINVLQSDMLKREFNIDYYAINISVELIQHCLPLTHEFVSLFAKKDIDPSYVSSHPALAYTWSTSNIYLAGEERIGNIRDCAQELVGHFIDAYLSVNPKRE